MQSQSTITTEAEIAENRRILEKFLEKFLAALLYAMQSKTTKAIEHVIHEGFSFPFTAALMNIILFVAQNPDIQNKAHLIDKLLLLGACDYGNQAADFLTKQNKQLEEFLLKKENKGLEEMLAAMQFSMRNGTKSAHGTDWRQQAEDQIKENKQILSRLEHKFDFSADWDTSKPLQYNLINLLTKYVSPRFRFFLGKRNNEDKANEMIKRLKTMNDPKKIFDYFIHELTNYTPKNQFGEFNLRMIFALRQMHHLTWADETSFLDPTATLIDNMLTPKRVAPTSSSPKRTYQPGH